MLYNTKLNEFTIPQIDRLLLVVTTEVLTLQMTLARIESWEDSTIKETIYNETQKQWDDLTLWKVQLINAKEDIKQLVNSN